ncbi:MAG: hypothetical protein ACOZNI_02440 [Myxococcota bacterium]
MLTVLLFVACEEPAPPPAAPAEAPAPPAAPAPPPPPAPFTCCADPALEAKLGTYLTAQEKLAKDDATAAAEIAQLDPALGVTADTPIADQRKQLKAFSDTFVAQVRSSAGGATAVREVHCPMYPGSWLQKGETIANPYYGSQMLTCGSWK